MGLYIERKEGERELDSGETERVCVRGRALHKKVKRLYKDQPLTINM